jgi:transcriptional regulator with XRE-family HTH domain
VLIYIHSDDTIIVMMSTATEGKMAWKFDKARLTALREMKGFSQDKFAAEIGSIKQQVSRWETGSKIPSTSTIMKICNLFQVKPDYFFTANDHHSDDTQQETK